MKSYNEKHRLFQKQENTTHYFKRVHEFCQLREITDLEYSEYFEKLSKQKTISFVGKNRSHLINTININGLFAQFLCQQQ